MPGLFSLLFSISILVYLLQSSEAEFPTGISASTLILSSFSSIFLSKCRVPIIYPVSIMDKRSVVLDS